MDHLIETWGYVAIFVVVTLGSAGLPLPSAAFLAAAAVYAGSTHNLNIGIIVGVAAVAAILGNVIGYGLGRLGGLGLVERYGPHLGLNDRRLQFGRFVFTTYANWAVVVGRFVGPLRAWIGLLAGINEMPLGPFVRLSILGGIAWALVWGLGSYLVGSTDHQVSMPGGLLGWAILAGAAVVVLRRASRRLMAEVDAANVDAGTAPPA